MYFLNLYNWKSGIAELQAREDKVSLQQYLVTIFLLRIRMLLFYKEDRLFSIKYYKFLNNSCWKPSTTETLFTAEIAKTCNICSSKHPNLRVLARPGLTDCGGLGKIILGGPQIKVKTKINKKKGHSHFLQPFHTNQCHQQYSYPNTAAK